MPAGWLQAKKAKQKRMRRAYLKHYPSRGIDIHKMEAYNYFTNTRTVTHEPMRQDTASPIKKNTFMQSKPATRGDIVKDNVDLHIAKERQLFEVRQAERIQSIGNYIRWAKLSDSNGVQVYLYACGGHYKIVQEGILFKSISVHYTNRDRLLSDWNKGKVHWDVTEAKP